jgi:hypothetical protein
MRMLRSNPVSSVETHGLGSLGHSQYLSAGARFSLTFRREKNCEKSYVDTGNFVRLEI